MKPDYIIAYHGTSKGNAQRIIENKYSSSKKTTEWLGGGVYFFLDIDPAENWAKQRFSDEAETLKSKISMKNVKVLNLLFEKDRFTFKRLVKSKVKSIYKKMFEREEALIWRGNQNKFEEEFRCRVFNDVKEDENYGIVIASFENISPYQKSYAELLERFRISTAIIQICVSDDYIDLIKETDIV
ncbi:MAG: hypothetical protein GX361_05085 [Bacteroidales bacterium]|nr:hypothetical protein [Bacteroidales bacterium]